MREDGMVDESYGMFLIYRVWNVPLSLLSHAKKDKDKRNLHHYLLICGKGEGMGTEIAGNSGTSPPVKAIDYSFQFIDDKHEINSSAYHAEGRVW